MVTNETGQLSASLEDYLETIFNLSIGDNVARGKDIAESMGVSKSSVTGALRTLADKGLANYKPYGFVSLTARGRATARKVAEKHEIIKSFFVNILGVDEPAAQKAACKAEHALGLTIISQLLNFMEFVSQNNGNGQDLARQFSQFCKDNPRKKKNLRLSVNDEELEPEVLLSHIQPGQEVRLMDIDADQELKSRLAAMGLINNTMITVVSNNSPGPFIVNVKGSRIALGRGMVDKIMVQQQGNGDGQPENN